MRILDWFDPGEGASVSSLETLQSKLGRVFPADYAAFVVQHSGANNPSECAFTVVDEGGARFGSNFGAVLRIDDEAAASIQETMQNLGDQLPADVVPIVDTGFGDYVCLRFVGGAEPVVAYYSSDRPKEQAMLPLAATFSDFLDILEIPEDM